MPMEVRLNKLPTLFFLEVQDGLRYHLYQKLKYKIFYQATDFVNKILQEQQTIILLLILLLSFHHIARQQLQKIFQ